MIDKCCNVVYNYFVIIIYNIISDKKPRLLITSNLGSNKINNQNEKIIL